MAVLLRTIDYTGSVLVDGRELRTVPRELVRSRFVTISQDGLQLQGSIRLNLDPYNPPGYNSGTQLVDQTLITALTSVGMWDVVYRVGGLETEMATANFSQGQLQLLGLARAILRNSYTRSKVVLIDEATSSVDDGTDRGIQVVLGEAFAGCTVFMTSHRQYAFEGMDQIVKVSDGYVEGTLSRDPDSGLLVET